MFTSFSFFAKTIVLLQFFLFHSSMTTAQPSQLRYLALGDSYTIGEGVAEKERWPVVLANRLDINPPDIIAKTGWTTFELQDAIKSANPGTNYDLVSLLIGVNDQYRGRHPKGYAADFKQLLKQAIAFAGGDPEKVFVVSIPDYGVTPFAAEKNPQQIAEEIDTYNRINKEISTNAGVAYFDITPISRKAAQDATLLAADQLHPSAKMYGYWVDSYIAEVKKMIAR